MPDHYHTIPLKLLGTNKSKFYELFIVDVPAEYEDNYWQSAISALVPIIHN
jgi:hypothetical protein